DELRANVGLTGNGGLAKSRIITHAFQYRRSVRAEAVIEVDFEVARWAPRAHAVQGQSLGADLGQVGDVGLECVNRVFGHLTIGGPLPTRHVHDAVSRVVHAMTARKVGGALTESLTLG